MSRNSSWLLPRYPLTFSFGDPLREGRVGPTRRSRRPSRLSVWIPRRRQRGVLASSRRMNTLRLVPSSVGRSPDQSHLTVTAIAIGDEHGLALMSDGTPRAWGNAYKIPAGLNDI